MVKFKFQSLHIILCWLKKVENSLSDVTSKFVAIYKQKWNLQKLKYKTYP